jgi:hypothetical protein
MQLMANKRVLFRAKTFAVRLFPMAIVDAEDGSAQSLASTARTRGADGEGRVGGTVRLIAPVRSIAPVVPFAPTGS